MSTSAPKFRAFILGERRSGSNFLRTTLNACSQISAPHPPHILHTFHDLVESYGDLQNDANWHELVSDVVNCTNLSPVPLLSSSNQLTTQSVIKEPAHRNLPGLQDSIYRKVMDEDAKQGWVCKSNDNIHYLEDIEACYGDTARYLFLVRDGRDVAMSFRKAPIGPKHPYICGEEWAAIQRTLLAWEERVGKRLLRVRYEDLLNDQAGEIQRICDFLGVTFEADMLSANQSAEAKRTASQSMLWANIDKPVMTNNFNKFMTDDPENVRLFECAAADMLKHFGYALMFEDELTHYSAKDIMQFDQEDQSLRQQAQQQYGKDGGQREQQGKFLRALREKKGVRNKRNSTIANL